MDHYVLLEIITPVTAIVALVILLACRCHKPVEEQKSASSPSLSTFRQRKEYEIEYSSSEAEIDEDKLSESVEKELEEEASRYEREHCGPGPPTKISTAPPPYTVHWRGY